MSAVVTVEFRDGEHDVPDYFVRLLSASSVDFYAVTYEEAQKIVNNAMTTNYLNNFQEQMIVKHLIRNNSWE
jgi:hypothetical protein